MLKHILFFSFMLLLCTILLIVSLQPGNNAVLWSVIGLVTYIIISAIEVWHNPQTDLGKSSAAGQLFIFSLILGPLLTILVVSTLLPTQSTD